MDPLQFCYWLQGFAELNSGTPPNEMQWKAIRDHLATVFNKVTPSYPGLGPDWQKEIIKDWKPNPSSAPEYPFNPNRIYLPPVWYGPNVSPPAGPYTVTCNNSTMSIC